MIRRRDRIEQGASRFSTSAGCLLLGLFCFVGPALAQHPGAAGTAPPPPAGNGVLTVQIRPDPGSGINDEALRGVAIALYALGPDGNPGFTDAETDFQGTTVFEGISTNPEIVYLVGAHFEGIPFGERVTFAPGASTARVEVEISRPTDQVKGVKIEELRVRLDWMGDRVLVREILRLVNPGGRVVMVPEQDTTQAIVLRTLPPDATDFSAGSTSIGDGLALDAGRVRFSGPLYPGEQAVEYQYSLPITEAGGTIPIQLREDVHRVVIVAGTAGLEAEGADLIPSSAVASDSGQPLAAWARARLAGGQRFDVAVRLPDTRRDASLVSVPRTDLWLELDDARLTATVDVKLEVAPGTPISGTPESPLFHVSLPTDATLNGVAPEAEALGLIPTDDGGFDVIGPIGAGETSLGYSYQMPAKREGVDLDLRFPRAVGTLNVLIADTEIEIDSSRLHRRRPFRSGTRNFLHREAYQVATDEVVDLRVAPIRGGDIPRIASGGLALVALAGGVYFLVIPLITARRREPEIDPEWAPIRTERESIYASIRDLDHDFETGKLEDADYLTMREGLRARAIELLRMERSGQIDSATPATPASPAMTASTTPARVAPGVGSGGDDAAHAESHVVAGARHEISTGAYCPHCGKAVKSEWLFCTHCGGQLDPAAGAGV